MLVFASGSFRSVGAVRCGRTWYGISYCQCNKCTDPNSTSVNGLTTGSDWLVYVHCSL